MYLSIYLFKLFLAIMLATFQSCFLSSGSKQNLLRQTPSYTVSLRSGNQTDYFEDEKIPINILFTSEDKNISNNGMGVRLKKIAIAGISGHLETEKGSLLEEGYDFFYQDEGYPLFFVPVFDQADGHCEISLETVLIDKYGHEAPASTHKVASYQLYICHKQVIEESIQEEKEEEDESIQEEASIQKEEESVQEAKDAKTFSATLRPLSEDYFSYKESKWELNIFSDLCDNEPYKIIDLQLEQGVLNLDGCDLKVGDEVCIGHQELLFVPNGFVGQFSPTIVIQNSQLETTIVSLQEHDGLFQDPVFFAKAVCDDNISITVGGKDVPSDEEWTLADWSFEGGVTGNLYDGSNSNHMSKPFKLQAGTTYIGYVADIPHLSGTPIIVLSIVHPDGKKETIRVDISSIVLPVLEAKLNECKTLLSDSIALEIELGIRKQAIRQSKEIITQMDYLLGEEVKTKIGSIIEDYYCFLKSNKSAFHQSIRLSEIASR